MTNQLSKQSTDEQLQSYFENVLRLSKSGSEFPINLDDVWRVCYSEKGKAVRALTSVFIEGTDYEVFAQDGKNLLGGRPTNEYRLSVQCLEFFIARKVRAVF